MTTLFKLVLSGMEDNNKIHGVQFSDWIDAYHAIEVYETSFDGEIDEKEMETTVKALNLIIKSNGEKYEQAVDAWNNEIWLQTFGNNYGSVAFGG